MITVYLCMHNTNSSSIDAHVNLGGHVCLWFCALCAHCAHFVYFVYILCILCELCKFCAFCASVHMRTCSPYQPRTIHTSKKPRCDFSWIHVLLSHVSSVEPTRVEESVAWSSTWTRSILGYTAMWFQLQTCYNTSSMMEYEQNVIMMSPANKLPSGWYIS